MDMQIYGSLDRQAKALDLLQFLLEEEFALLMQREAEAIMSQEFSIHELLRQLANEKENVIRLLGGGRVLDYAEMLLGEEKQELHRLWNILDNKEQACARQASMNTELSLGLLDQSEKLLVHFQQKLIPPTQAAYGRKGAYTNQKPQAMLFSKQG